ncbi:AMP-dependent synthetase/ligase [Luteococcus sp. Sow4_B9]|uniref:AMP-dependent synthetase/ligase n=1 Tax=Luteococcus sp. Sow4_B9 TaxID=3438792 RepID=UPI003F972375
MTSSVSNDAKLIDNPPRSIAALFQYRIDKTPQALAFLVPDRDGGEKTEWREVTFREFHDEVADFAAGLLSLGVQVEDRIAIASSTRYEWVLASMAITCAGGAITSVYPNSTAHDVLFILQDSGTSVLVAENQSQIDKVQAHDDELYEQLKHIIIIDDDRTAADRVDRRVMTWEELRRKGQDLLADRPEAVREVASSLEPDTLANLIYTSGTTGRPKGVELTHRAIVADAVALDAMEIVFPEDRHYLWLPLSHVFGGCLVASQWAMGYSTAVDGRVDRIVQGLQETHPTVVCGVPRIFEKIRATVITSSPSKGPKARIARWAFAVGREALPHLHQGTPMPRGLARRYAVADKLVFTKLRETMGGRIRIFISGSAKLSPQISEWFYAAGLNVIEGYGSTETTISVLNPPDRQKFGSIGPVVPGMEASLAEDGELRLRGPLLMRGYHNRPEQTAEVLRDGWFHTGDIAEIDDEGYIFITDRKKDLIKTSGGKYVAPQKVENAIAANIPYVSQALAFGENRKYIVALVTLDRDALMKWGKNHGYPKASYEELSQLPEVKKSIDRFMERANGQLERWETVKRYRILDHELSMDDGTVTATSKARRDVIARKYAHLVDSLYDPE